MLYIILLPMLLSFILIPLIGNKRFRSDAIALMASGITFAIALAFLFYYLNHNLYENFTWFSLGGLSFDIALLGGNLNLIMALLVSFISMMVLLFSVFYMKNEPQERYYAEMSLFIFSMMGLVISGSLLLLYIFWELVGVSSYLLIGFYYRRESASAAGKKALIMTRIGDIAFLSAIIILFTSLHSFSIPYLLNSYSMINPTLLATSVVLLIIAALSKSAQFPFYTWLPDAMEGPTPVSALLHSATMVAAGAFILVLLSPILYATNLSLVIVIISIITSFIAALLALKSIDFKRILAYSTIESLSFMFLAVGVFNTGGAVFYLITHAVFKSLLFLIAGTLLILLSTQNIYWLKRKNLSSSWLYFPTLIGLFSLLGIPPFMGFFAHLSLGYTFNIAYDIIFAAMSFLTALFSFRLFFTVFHSSGERLLKPIFSFLPIVILSIISVMGGILLFYLNSYLPIPYSITLPEIVDLASVALGGYISFILFYKDEHKTGIRVFLASSEKIFKISYNDMLNAFGNAILYAGKLANKFDFALSSFYNDLSDVSFKASAFSRRFQDGDVETYISAILIGVLILIFLGAIFI